MMNEQMMTILKVSLEVLEMRMFLWMVTAGAFVLFAIAINSANVYTIACAVLYAVIVFLPTLKANEAHRE
jgi:uncharacterized membrane protein